MSGWNDPGADPAEAWDRTRASAPSHAELAERELLAANSAQAPADRFEPLYFAGVHAQLAIAEELAGLREQLAERSNAGESLEDEIRASYGLPLKRGSTPTEVHVHTTGSTDSAAHERMRNVAARYPYLFRNTNR